MKRSAIAEARALDYDAQEGRTVPSCASQSIGLCYNIRRQWPTALVTNKQELLVFRAITAFRCETDDSESDLIPMQEEVIDGARWGSLLHELTKLVHTLSCI